MDMDSIAETIAFETRVSLLWQRPTPWQCGSDPEETHSTRSAALARSG